MEYGLSDNGEQPDQHGKGVSRRNVLLGLASTLVATALAGAPFLTLAEQYTAAQNPLLFARFFALSRQLTERQDIDPGLSARIFTALSLANPQFSSQVERLSARVKAGQSARQLQQIAGQLGLSALVSAIVTAWYTGTVGQGANASLIAYKDALMYRPVKDALIVPTYCGNGPLWWTAAPPEVNALLPSES